MAGGVRGPALFVSDLHLAPERPALADRFRRFVATEARGASALYVLGDFFEYWLGEDEARDPFTRTLLDALGGLAANGTPVHFMQGNRDFLFGARAAERAGVTLLPDPAVVELFGVRTLLMHGDTLCTDDVRYQRYRAKVRNPWVQRVFLAMPRALRAAAGRGLRKVSEAEKQVKRPMVMDVNVSAVQAALRAHGYPRLIHGHTHRPGRHVHVVDGRECERWVLGDWYERASCLRVDGAGVREVALD